MFFKRNFGVKFCENYVKTGEFTKSSKQIVRSEKTKNFWHLIDKALRCKGKWKVGRCEIKLGIRAMKLFNRFNQIRCDVRSDKIKLKAAAEGQSPRHWSKLTK